MELTAASKPLGGQTLIPPTSLTSHSLGKVRGEVEGEVGGALKAPIEHSSFKPPHISFGWRRKDDIVLGHTIRAQILTLENFDHNSKLRAGFLETLVTSPQLPGVNRRV
jgi:hypothetical protein